MKVIFSTDNCYEGYSKFEEAYVNGNIYDMLGNEEIEQDTIEFSQVDFECEKDYFKSFLNEHIQAYEKRYHTEVKAIGVIGSVGLWNGNRTGGIIIGVNENPIEWMVSVDKIEVCINDNGEISLLGYHHDGCHAMYLYLLSENKLRKYAPEYLEYQDYDYQDIEAIYKNLKPLKVGKIGFAYYGDYKRENKKIA